MGEDNNGEDILFQQAEWLKEEIKETFDDWADRIAREYADKRDRYNRQNSGAGSKRTATGGIGAGKRGKEGRRNRKERKGLNISIIKSGELIITSELRNQQGKRRKSNRKKTTRKRWKICAKAKTFCHIRIFPGHATGLFKTWLRLCLLMLH